MVTSIYDFSCEDSSGNKVNLFGFKNTDLKQFDQENIEKLLSKKLIEKKLIKPIYLS